MENEKNQGAPKNEQGASRGGHSHHRHRPRRPKSYFIEPADGAAPAEQKPASAEPKQNPPREEAKKPSEQGENRNKHHNHHNNHNRNRHKKDSKPIEQGAAAPKQEAPERKHAAEQPKQNPKGEQKNNSSRNNRGRRGNHSGDDKLMPMQDARPARVAPIEETDSEYEEIRFPSASEERDLAAPIAEEPPVMVEVIGIRFKSSGKVYYFDPNGKTAKRGEYAIVETSRGQEYGEVALGNTTVKESDTVPPLRPILRIANEADRLHHEENKKKEESAFRVCNEKIQAHGLDMKLIDAQYTFDNSKLLFYFTSAGRVDFRDLVKDLASVFRTRIELRQIGIRDEAKLMGGIGMCGRSLCCTRFLSDFGQVSIKMAKEQNLSLNSAKISGICGRLMCCLRYEHETYEYEIKRTPPVDSTVRTADGNGIVTEINPLVGTVKVRLLASPDTPPKLYRREDVVMLQKKQPKQEKSDK